MTDRIFQLTVLLEEPMRDDDVQRTVEATQMVKGVSGVKPHVSDGMRDAIYRAQRGREVYDYSPP